MEDFIDVIGFRMKDFRDSYQVTDNLGELICISHVGQRPPGSCNYCVICVTLDMGREEGKAAGGGTLNGLGKDMYDHKYGVAFLQISQDFSMKKRCPRRLLKDIYRTMNGGQMMSWAELVASFYIFNARAAQQPMK